jgi:glycerophosphoryl diester phosphodiesterase
VVRRIGLALALAVLFGPGSGTAEKREPIQTRRPNLEIGRCAHRGAWHYAPENTVPAMLKAVEQGYQWIEIDVRYSRDGVPVLHHDAWTIRDSLIPLPVRALTFAQLKKLDEGFWYGPKFWGTRVASVEEVLVAVQGKVNLYLDLKEPPSPEFVQLLRKYGFAPDHILVLAGPNGEKFLEMEPAAKYLAHSSQLKDLDRLLEKFPTAYALNVGCASLTPEMVDAAHSHGLRIFSNVINLMPWQTRSCMRVPILCGADVTQIDNLRVFNEVREEIQQEQPKQ